MDKPGHSWPSVPVNATVVPMCSTASHLGTAATEWCSSSAAVGSRVGHWAVYCRCIKCCAIWGKFFGLTQFLVHKEA